MRGTARIYDVRMAQFVLKIEKLSHIIGARGSQDLRSPSPIMAPASYQPRTKAVPGNVAPPSGRNARDKNNLGPIFRGLLYGNVRQNSDQERTNHNALSYLRTALPYNKEE